jgi:exopolysaccharide biosynthesis polyprenyl glycosylphosphotransferase
MLRAHAHVQFQAAMLVVVDLLCLLVGWAGAVFLRLGGAEFYGYVSQYVHGILVFSGGVVLANYVAGGYQLHATYSRFNLVVTWFFSMLVAFLLLSAISYVWLESLMGRGVLLLLAAVYSVISLTLKMLLYQPLFRSRWFECRALVMGFGDRAHEIRKVLERPFVMPAHRVVAFWEAGGARAALPAPGAAHVIEKDIDGVPVVTCEDPGELLQLVRRLQVNVIAIGLDDMGEVSRFYPQLRRLRFEGVEVLMPVTVAEFYTGCTPVELVNEEMFMQAMMESQQPLVQRIKRISDIVLAIVAGVLSLPFVFLVVAAIKLESLRGSIVYSQLRVGQFGRPFRIYKFRTMREHAEAMTGPVWSTDNDPRITRVGRVLRKFRLDEIPQIINILKGEMSVVGPRPERPAIVAELAKQIPHFEERTNAVPGLSGWAQICYPYGNTVEDAKRKLEYDLYYIKHINLRLDLQIILSTLRILFFGMEKSRR